MKREKISEKNNYSKLYLPIGGVGTKSTESTKSRRKVSAVSVVLVGRGGIGE